MKSATQSKALRHSMKGPVMVEQRSHQRYRCRVALGWTSKSSFYTGLCHDISVGGLFIATYQLLPTGTAMEVEIRLPDEEGLIRVAGEVRWTRPDSPRRECPIGMGVQFVDLEEEDRRRIERFIARRDTEFFED